MWWKRDWTKRKKDRYTPDTQVSFEVPASIACQLRWFFPKISVAFLYCMHKSHRKNISRPFPVDKVKYVQQLKGNEYETRNNEHSVLHSEDETSEKR